MAAILSGDWDRMYSHPIYFAETFIDPGRFRGTCYRAANWRLLGLTTGRGKNDQTNKPNRPIQGNSRLMPLTPRFREHLTPDMTIRATDRREPGRTGPDYRSKHARPAQRIRRPEAQERRSMPCSREISAENGIRRKPSAVLPDATGKAEARAGVIGSSRSWAQRADFRPRLPVLIKLQSHTPRSIPATFAQSAAGEKCIA